VGYTESFNVQEGGQVQRSALPVALALSRFVTRLGFGLNSERNKAPSTSSQNADLCAGALDTRALGLFKGAVGEALPDWLRPTVMKAAKWK